LRKIKFLFPVLLAIIVITSGLVVIASENITVIRNEEIEILYNGQTQKFSDVTGKVVYPLSYEGTTYLPVRAISSLFQVPIKWNSITKTVSLGDGELDTRTAESVDEFIAGKNENITVILNNEITIEFFGFKQYFKDVTGKVVYPLSYEGTIYLPVRAISNLFDAEIEWDGENNAITITDDNYVKPTIPDNLISQADTNWTNFCFEYADIQSTISIKVAELYGNFMLDVSITTKPRMNQVLHYVITGVGYDAGKWTWTSMPLANEDINAVAITSGNLLGLTDYSFTTGEWIVMNDCTLYNTLGVVNPYDATPNTKYATPTLTLKTAQTIFNVETK
jgi:hypothetical protein